jgi:hypothetical protein
MFAKKKTNLTRKQRVKFYSRSINRMSGVMTKDDPDEKSPREDDEAVSYDVDGRMNNI